MIRVIRVSVACLLAACSPDAPPPASSQRVVQVVSTAPNPKSLGCKAGGTFEVYINVRLVNTTSEAVTITKVASAGTILASSHEELVGRDLMSFLSLAFAREPPVLRAGDGDITVTVILEATCVSVGMIVRADDFVDSHVILLVRTSAGEYAALPFLINMNYS